MDQKAKALAYHKYPFPGKLSVEPSKPSDSIEELSLAYTPGVAFPCLEIAANADAVYDYTIRGNTVAVITDGSAVLGLGNIGPAASLPVMEGKCLLLKTLAGINGVPLAIKRTSIDEFVSTVSSLEDNFGAINLEDIKAPECFEIEEKLQELMGIPVFHDDQHGTAIIILAALKNSVDVVGKTLTSIRIVINGAGAAGIATANLFLAAGIAKEQIILVDTHGVVYKGRNKNMNRYKDMFANTTTSRTLAEAMRGADVFIGVSKPHIVNESMIRSMNRNAIVFALANPIPEIMPDEAKSYGAAVVAVGRSDFPNQVNNVLGFPGIFRGALDSRATRITTSMKLAAVEAIVAITKEEIPDDIYTYLSRIYPDFNDRALSPSYILPKPFDPRNVPRVAGMVAKQAINYKKCI